VVVPKDSDGGYTLKPGTQYTDWFYIELSPAGCVTSVQASYSWTDGTVRRPYSCDHGLYVGTDAAFGFVTPTSASLSQGAPEQRVTLMAETNSATAKKEVSIRFAQ
jgi:hypothetical protein